jgi:pterin-4a-carbinolamine dehydratase
MFLFTTKNDEVELEDYEMIVSIDKFLTLIYEELIEEDEEYVLMRWNFGEERWTASKYNKFKAKEFLNSYVFVNSLLSKSHRGMHYDEGSIDYFRCKF